MLRSSISRWIQVLAVIIALAMAAPAFAENVIKIGASAPKTGPLAGGSSVSFWPNVELWVKQVNDRGGLQLKDGKAKIELIQYDDRTIPGEAIKNIQRLATQDKVDFILAPYGTGFTLATAPLFAKFNYPLIAHTAITDKVPELTKRYPNVFFTLGTTSGLTDAAVDVLKKLREAGQIGSRIAMVNVADAFGIELANAAKPVFKTAGFEIVYETSYPLGTQDLSPVVRGAKQSNPDVFVAWSYPPDTFGLTAQAKVQELNVGAYYVAVATAFPAFGAKFGASAEGILGAGGINPDAEATEAYFTAHESITGKKPDYWASSMVYASFQVLEKSIEAVGSKDRDAVIAHIKENTFDTVVGPLSFKNQNNESYWTVGQWQDGKFYGVHSTGRKGAREVRTKPKW